MAIRVEVLSRTRVRITITRSRRKDIRLQRGLLDWMFRINDFRDIINALTDAQIEYLYTILTEKLTGIIWQGANTADERLQLKPGIILVRRAGPGGRRKVYQSVSLLISIRNTAWPGIVDLSIKDIAYILKAMITIDTPPNYKTRDSVRNAQFIWAIFWLRKEMTHISATALKLTKEQILRLGLP